jgi:tetratricopeptide (TPR) repeat protein
MRGMRHRESHRPALAPIGRSHVRPALLPLLFLLACACAAVAPALPEPFRALPEPFRALPEPRRFAGPEPFDEQARLDLGNAARLIHEARFEEATPIIDQLCADVSHPDNHPRFVVMQGAFQLKGLLAYLSGDPKGGDFWLGQGYRLREVMWGASWQDATESLILDELHYAERWPAARRSDLYLWAAVLFDQLAQPEQELLYARMAAAVDTTSVRKASALAAALFRSDRIEESLSWFERAVAAGTPEAEVLRDYGVALNVAGRDAEARGVLEKAVALDPGDLDARLNLVIACYLGSDLAAAEAVYRQAWDRFRMQRRRLQAVSLYFLIDGGRDREAWRQARAAGRDLLLSLPQTTSLWAVALETNGRQAEAVAAVRELLAREPRGRDPDYVSRRWFLRRRVLALYTALLAEAERGPAGERSVR